MSDQYKVVTGDILTNHEDRRAHIVTDSRVERRIRFVNASSKILFICSVDGSIIKMKPSISQGHRESLIIVHETFPHDNEVTWIEGSECPTIREIRLAAIQNGRIDWEEVVPIGDIEKQINGVYLRMHDVVVTTNHVSAYMKHHPRCRQKVHNDFVNAINELEPDKMLAVIIRLVDNSGGATTRYTVFHNCVQRLVPIMQPDMLDGVYITGLVEIDGNGNRTQRSDQHYTFEQIEKGEAPIRLFATIHEANAGKDELALKELEAMEAISKREHEKIMLERKRESDQEKISYEQEKVRMERRNMEIESQLRDRAWEIDRLKSEREDMLHRAKHTRGMESESYSLQIASLKAQQEKNSNDQKTFSDTIKTIGLIAGAVIAIKALM